MIGLCIGTGDWYRVAQRAAAQMSRMTSLPCRVISRVDSDLVHSSWHKLNLLREYPGETLLIFDADMWCKSPWNPHAYGSTGLAMVPEPPNNPSVLIECGLYHVPVGHYYNGGLIIADQRAAPVFASTKRLHPSYGSWLEQTGLNHCIHALKFPVVEMPLACNCLLDANQPIEELRTVPAHNLHFAGRKTVARLHEIFDGLETK